MKILLTGFGPFDRFSFNPSGAVAERISSELDFVEHVILPVEYGNARRTLLSELVERKPDAVISFGLNGSIGHIAIEEIAVNISESERSDNEGNILSDVPIVEGGPLAYRTKLPSRSLIERLRREGIPANRSFSAGTYICNEVFYTELDWADNEPGRIAGFVHIPPDSRSVSGDIRMRNSPHMPMHMMERAARIIVKGVNMIR